MNLSRFDDLYFTIVKETGGVEGLLHSLFNFLIRRTDFFYEMDPGDKMGFPPGVALKMVISIFNQYQQEYYKKFPKKDPQLYEEKLKKYKENQTKTQPQPIEKLEKEEKKPDIIEKKIEIPQEIKKEKIEIKEEEIPKNIPEKNIEKLDNKKIISDISTYNGGKTDKYIWSQSVSDVTVQVKLPKGTKAKQILIEMKPDHLKIKLKSDNQMIIDGNLYDKIKVEDSIWSIEDEEKLILTLEKGSENIWKTIIKGDEEIDATKVDNSKKLEEFDFETQGALRKIMYEQQRKNMGLPTTEEEKQQELLQKAWNSEGSPFKGTPFDPSKFNMSGGNNFNLG